MARPYPRAAGDGKWKVWGRTKDGRLLQVIYILRDIDKVGIHELPPHIMMLAAPDQTVHYVIHARDLTDSERQQFRRKRGKA